MPQKSDSEPAVVVGKAYDLTMWLLPKVESFGRFYRLSVGERLIGHSIDLLLILVDAAYARDKTALLQQASVKTNGLRYLLRLAKDLRLLTVDSYGFASEKLEEIGRMIGGWSKASGRAK